MFLSVLIACHLFHKRPLQKFRYEIVRTIALLEQTLQTIPQYI